MSHHHRRRRPHQDLDIHGIADFAGGRSRGLDEAIHGLSWRVSSSVSHMEQLHVKHLLDRIDKILGKYRCHKRRRGEGVWTYYKRIPCRYWHEMLEAYTVFGEVVNNDASLRFGIHRDRFHESEIMKMRLYVKLLPALGNFDKCRATSGRSFGLCRRLVYDHAHCIVG